MRRRAVKRARFGQNPSPMHRAVAGTLVSASGGAYPSSGPYGLVLGRRRRPPAPRGWWSLARSIPTSRVSCRSRRHRHLESDVFRTAASDAFHRLRGLLRRRT